MPYLYHLSFELYPSPPPTFKVLKDPQPRDIHLPPAGTDIFEPENFPTHRESTWSGARPQRSKPKSAPSPEDKRPNYARRLSHLHSAPAERNNSPVPTTVPVFTEVASSNTTIDWRFDAVSLLSIDMAPVTLPTVGVATGSGLSTKGRFIPGDPKNTELGWGVVHLYRDAKETPGLYHDSDSNASETGQTMALTPGSFDEAACTTLCILAVPSYMTASDFLGFVGEKTREQVTHFRLIRSGIRNKYMVLMKFREAKDAGRWRKEWDGKLFNSMEPENCHVVFIKSIEFQTPDSHRDPSNFPHNTNDPFTPPPRPSPSAPLAPGSTVDTTATALASLSIKPMAPPTPSLIELPTCPVCLERMDETTGLLTILCQHVFHCACLEKWRGTGCPVCRYTQNPALGLHGCSGDPSDPTENECSICSTTSNLWICLVCGNIGCGRYDDAHAHAHYQSTSHAFAMDVATQHVWDYAGDGYVHRLIQNKADGKLVDLPAAHSRNANANANSGLTALGEDHVPREKLDNMAMEYTYLLTSQLDSQRSYYDAQLERATDKATQAAAAADAATSAVARLSSELGKLQDLFSASQSQISALEKDLLRQTTRAGTSAELARRMTGQYQEEKTINGALMTRIKHLEMTTQGKDEVVKRLEEEKRELEEQNRDLGFFISGMEKLKELEGGTGDLAAEEVREGFVEVPKEEEKKGRRKGKGKR